MSTETFVREALDARVTRGAAWLDRHAPAWHNGHKGDEIVETQHIDLDSLQLQDGQACVLGQMFGGYSRGAKRLGLWGSYYDYDNDVEVEAAATTPADPPEWDAALDRYTKQYGSSGSEYAFGFNLPDVDQVPDVSNEHDPAWQALTALWKGQVLSRRAEDALKEVHEVNTYSVTYVVEALDDEHALIGMASQENGDDPVVTLLHEGSIQ